MGRPDPGRAVHHHHGRQGPQAVRPDDRPPRPQPQRRVDRRHGRLRHPQLQDRRADGHQPRQLRPPDVGDRQQLVLYQQRTLPAACDRLWQPHPATARGAQLVPEALDVLDRGPPGDERRRHQARLRLVPVGGHRVLPAHHAQARPPGGAGYHPARRWQREAHLAGARVPQGDQGLPGLSRDAQRRMGRADHPAAGGGPRVHRQAPRRPRLLPHHQRGAWRPGEPAVRRGLLRPAVAGRRHRLRRGGGREVRRSRGRDLRRDGSGPIRRPARPTEAVRTADGQPRDAEGRRLARVGSGAWGGTALGDDGRRAPGQRRGAGEGLRLG